MDGKYEINDFSADVIERSRSIPVLVDFWAEWCGPCKVLGPVLERLAESNGSRWALAKVDTDAHQDIAARYGIRGIPSVKLFVDGAVADEFTGALPERAVVQWLEKALPNRFIKEIREAEQLILADKADQARSVLDGVLSRDAGNEHARVTLATTFLATESDKAAELVEGIEEDSRFFPLADAMRTISGLRAKLDHPDSLQEDSVRDAYLSAIRNLAAGRYREAVEGFIDVIRSNRYYDDDGARKACVAIFRILGEDHPVSREFRRPFGSALNV
jgi:putative thioredoxin